MQSDAGQKRNIGSPSTFLVICSLDYIHDKEYTPQSSRWSRIHWNTDGLGWDVYLKGLWKAFNENGIVALEILIYLA